MISPDSGSTGAGVMFEDGTKQENPPNLSGF